MHKTVSDVVVDTLVKAGAKRCYGIVGDTINHFTAALSHSPIEWVHVRHEEAGALAAGGEAYITQGLTLCAGTAGPGSLHFINGIFESHRNGAPVVLIASQIDRHEQGLNFPQEVDQKKLYEQCSVFCEYISHPEQARRITAQAAQAALTQKGVAVIIVNGDMFKEPCADALAWSVHTPAPAVCPHEADLETLAGLINKAENIAIYAGIGCRHAHDQVVALAEALQAPVVHTSRATAFLAHNNPYNVGMTGILGARAGFDAVNGCDLLLCLGTDFAYTQFYPAKAKIIQVDINPRNIGRRSPVHLGLVGDAGDTIKALLPRLEKRTSSAFLEKALKQHAHDQNERAEKEKPHSGDLIHPQRVAHLIDTLAAEDAIFTADGGSPMVWLLRHVQANGKRDFLLSLLHGTMANAYPQAMGIAKAYPGREVIALCGDGGMTMLMGDLLTLVQENIPLKIVVFNNSSLGFVEMEQKVEGMLDCYTNLKNPDFAQVATACGIYGIRVETNAQLEDGIKAWLAHPGAALLDVKVNRMELVMPPKVEPAQVASTALYGLKATLNGRADEVYQLLKSNFWQ